MKRFLALVLFLISFALAIPAVAEVTEPDSTRFATIPKGVRNITVDFAATGSDTTIWFGFEAYSAAVVRVTGDVIVTPLVLGAGYGTITDDSFGASGPRVYANPRAGEPKFYAEPDTLTSDFPRWDYCCQGILGITIEAVSTAGYCKVYSTAAKP